MNSPATPRTTGSNTRLFILLGALLVLGVIAWAMWPTSEESNRSEVAVAGAAHKEKKHKDDSKKKGDKKKGDKNADAPADSAAGK